MKHSQPLVSIIIPAYNRATRISRTLEAIINQNYDTLEIILVDDASMDDTVVTAERVLSQSGRAYKILKHETNLGVSVARNDGLKAAMGQYVWFCDSDDVVESNFVSVMVSRIGSDNTDIVICNLQEWYEHYNKYGEVKIYSDSVLSREEYFKAYGQGEMNLWNVCNCLFKRRFLVENKIRYRENLSVGEDGDFTTRALILSPKISFTAETSYTYMQYSENLANHDDWKRPNMHKHIMLATMYIARAIIRNTNHSKAINRAVSTIIYEYLKMCKLYAQVRDKENYDYMTKKFRHKKVREVMLSSMKDIFHSPETFIKAFMLIYLPSLYYKVRSM